MKEVTKNRRNNFDLIRLLAALNVACIHLVVFFQSPFRSSALQVLEAFNGVAILFFVSGFLLYASVDSALKHGQMIRYWRARALRLYPGLWLCGIVGAMALWIWGYFSGVSLYRILFWFGTIIVGGGFVLTPDFLRPLPTRCWNGSLWTIPVELSFYVALPLFFFLTKRLKDRRGPIMIAATLVSFCMWIYFDGFHWGDTLHANLLTKIVWFSLPANLWLFFLGSIARYYWRTIEPFVTDKLLICGIAYLVTFFLLSPITVDSGYSIYLCAAVFAIKRIVLALTVLSAAYSFRSISSKILRGNDISYGVYLYHWPVYNALLQFGPHSIPAGLVGVMISIGFGLLSWFVLERRCLALKDPQRPKPPELEKTSLASPSAAC